MHQLKRLKQVQVFWASLLSQTSNIATTATMYFQHYSTYLQKKIYSALLPNSKVKNNPKKKSKNNPVFEKPLHLAVAGYIGYFFLFMIGKVFINH